MKIQLTILALLFSFFAFSEDTTDSPAYLKRAEAALNAQDPQVPPTIIRIDTTKSWKNRFVVQPPTEIGWWEITKRFVVEMWNSKPALVILAGIMLLIGLWRLARGLFKNL